MIWKESRKCRRDLSLPLRTLAAPVLILLAGALGCGGGGGGGVGSGGGPPNGGSALATVTFTTGALPAGATVVVEKGTDVATFDAFEDTAGIYGPTGTAPYYVRITIGPTPPTGPAAVVVPVPAGYAPPAGDLLRLFGRIQTPGDVEQLDTFEDLSASWDTTAGTLMATLSPTAFAPSRSGDANMEAILLVASTHSPSASLLALPAAAGLASALGGGYCENGTVQCPTGCMRTPLLRTLRVTSPFNDPTRGEHPGADFRAETGTVAVAVGAGTVRQSRLSPNLPAGCVYAGKMVNSPRPCNQNWGFGETILLDVPGVGAVQYLHLQSRAFPDCCSDVDGTPCKYRGLPPCTIDGTVGGPRFLVSAGQAIGKTDTTGYTNDPHLHLELVTPAGVKVDPAPCILPPDYHGKFSTTTQVKGPNANFEETVTARADFSWSEAAHKYQASGTWNFSALSTDPDCTATVTNATGPIGPDDGNIYLGGVMNELLKGSYFLGTPGKAPPPLQYLNTGLTANAPVNVQYTCPEVTSTSPFPAINWWPTLFLSPDYPFFARPNPYSPSDPFEDFVETDVPDSGPTTATSKSSWNVSARMTPP